MRNITGFLFLLIFIGCKSNKEPNVTETIHSIDWISDRNNVRAGAILVPENHDEPHGKKIKMTYVVLKAKDTISTAFPLIYFSGGPGSNTLGKGMINYFLKLPFRENRDIILFDQRGIGYSSAFPDMSFDTFNIMAQNLNEAEELLTMKKMIKKYRIKCDEQNIRPEYYNSFQSAKDVGMLFKHLGYQKYNLWGISYGTRLGRIVQEMFPQFVYSSVFDSPAPLSGDFLLGRLDSYSLALNKIFQFHENDTGSNNRNVNIRNDYLTAISILKEKPLEITVNDSLKVNINAQDGVYLLRRVLYDNNAREKVPELIKAYLTGGGQVINDVLQYELDLTVGANLSMMLSVEKYENFNPSHSEGVIEEHYQKYPLIPVKMGFFDSFYRAGQNWHDDNLPFSKRKFENSDIPTLIFVNHFDPVTPPKNGHIFQKTLSNGILVTLDEAGHGVGNFKCKYNVMMDFINNPAGKLDLSCLNIYE